MAPSMLVRFLCRIYSVLLYAYPREFRLEYGGEMAQLFRDHCSHLARAHDRQRLIRFGLLSAADWLTTTIKERIASVWSAGRLHVKRNFVTEWALTILIYLFATTTLMQAYVVPTGSMEKNLMVGDHMLVDRLVYSDPGPLGAHLLPYREPQRGDIVAFLYPEDVRQTYVKRVIGLPGDRIRLENKQVIRNGHRLIEPYTQHVDESRFPYRDDFPTSPEFDTTPRGLDMFAHHITNGEVIVPPGTLFMMGDNRENSADSRYWGFVPREYVVGKPLFVYWSYDAPTRDLEQWTLTHVLDVAAHFFTRTRWDRTLFVPRSEAAQEQ